MVCAFRSGNGRWRLTEYCDETKVLRREEAVALLDKEIYVAGLAVLNNVRWDGCISFLAYAYETGLNEVFSLCLSGEDCLVAMVSIYFLYGNPYLAAGEGGV